MTQEQLMQLIEEMTAELVVKDVRIVSLAKSRAEVNSRLVMLWETHVRDREEVHELHKGRKAQEDYISNLEYENSLLVEAGVGLFECYTGVRSYIDFDMFETITDILGIDEFKSESVENMSEIDREPDTPRQYNSDIPF